MVKKMEPNDNWNNRFAAKHIQYKKKTESEKK